MNNIITATSVRYGNYKDYKWNAQQFENVIVDKFKKIRKYVNLPEDDYITFVLRPIKSCYGRAYVDLVDSKDSLVNYIVELDVRQSLSDYYNTLIHELVHIEQYYEDRLCMRTAGAFVVWDGKRYREYSSAHELYNQQPWEIEASERAEKIVPKIFR